MKRRLNDIDFKNPKKMVNTELLEVYSQCCNKDYRDEKEQDYTALLREEMLKRMGDNQ